MNKKGIPARVNDTAFIAVVSALLIIFSFATSCFSEVGIDWEVQNVSPSLDKKRIAVSYDLVSTSDEAISSDGVLCEVSFYVDRNGKRLIPKYFSGDVGGTVTPGPGKMIYWDHERDFQHQKEKLSGTLNIDVIVEGCSTSSDYDLAYEFEQTKQKLCALDKKISRINEGFDKKQRRMANANSSSEKNQKKIEKAFKSHKRRTKPMNKTWKELKLELDNMARLLNLPPIRSVYEFCNDTKKGSNSIVFE